MITNDHRIDIDAIIGHTDYTASRFYPGGSSNQLFKIGIDGSNYLLKIYRNTDCFEKEPDFMYLFNTHKCKTPRLVNYGSADSQSWILYEYVTGISLDQIKNQLETKTLKQVWRQVGKELKKIHSLSILNEREKEKNRADFIGHIERSIIRFSNCLNEQDVSPLLIEAIHFLKNNFSHIKKTTMYGIALYDFDERHIILDRLKGKWAFQAFVDFEQTCFGCLYVDIAALYICTLLDKEELEKSFWAGYGSGEMMLDDHCVCFFILYFGLELCTVLRKVNVHHFEFGLFVIQKALAKIYRKVTPNDVFLQKNTESGTKIYARY